MRKILLLITILPILVFGNSKSFQNFLDKIAKEESGFSYTEIGGAGNKYFGKYQFSNIALREIGWGHITVRKFRSNKSIFPPEKQETAMLMLIDKYEYYLSREINKYSEKYFKGKYVTKSGIIAACHGVGYPQVLLYFKGKSTKTKLVERYLKQFSGYSIS